MSLRKTLAAHTPFVGALITAHVLIYHDYWTLQKLFTGSDFFQLFAPVANFQSDCLQEGSWPLWNPYINFGFPWVGNYVNSSLFPSHLILGLLTRFGVELLQLEILVWILIGGFGVYLCAIELGRSRLASLIAAVSFMFCGQMIALPQWGGMVYNATLFPYLLIGYERAKKRAVPFSALASVSIALAVFGGYVPATVVGIYFFAGYVMLDSILNRKMKFGIVFLLPTLAAGVLLALPKLVPLYLSMKASPRLAVVSSDPRFGVISGYNFLTYLLPVKFYFSLYIGQISILAIIYAGMRKKLRLDALLGMFLLTAWFLITDASGNPSFLRQVTNAIFPFIDLIRLEFIYWYYPSVFLLLFASRYVDDFLGDGDILIKGVAVGLFAVILSMAFVSAYNISLFAGAFFIHIILVLLWGGGMWLAKRPAFQRIAVVVILILEFGVVFARVGIDAPPVERGQNLDIVLTDQNYISPSFYDDQRVADLMPLRITQDHLRPKISDSKQWPYLLPRTPGWPIPNYAEVLNMKRFTGWWYNPQETFAFGKLKDSDGFQQLHNQPLFLLYDRTTGSVANGRTSFDAISCSSFDFSVNAAEPGFFLLNQMYDDRWKVLVDGKEQPLRRANEYFMGTEIAPGAHNVAFRFRDTTFMISLAISGMTVIALILAGLFRIRRRMKSWRPPATC